jgi:hypothetical protein
MTTTWHADEGLLSGYSHGELDDVRASSLEAHLLGCGRCRELLASAADRTSLDRMWSGISETVDAPQAGLVERALVGLGVREHVARLLAATPSLRLSWFLAEAVALGFAVWAANEAVGGVREDLAMLMFLVIAALLPVAGVAAAYGPGVDPAYDIGRASPMQSLRLLLIRAVAVLGASALIASLGAVALPSLDWRFGAWLLPSLALTLASLALSTYVLPLTAAGLVTFVWLLVAAIATTSSGDRFIVFRGTGQTVFVLVVAVSALVIAQRRDVFEQGGRR